MTLLVAGITLVLTSAFTFFVGSAAATASDRAVAQTAADAAALAAAGAMVPGVHGEPEEEARRFAAANGARFITCSCGSAEAVVTVERAGIRARAKAVLDPARLGPQSLGGTAAGLHPTLQAAVGELLAAAKGRVTLVSGWRSTQRQTELWQDALRRYGDPEIADNWVARPGSSMHERGLAVDLGGDLDLAARLAGSLGLPLHRPLAHEPWHFELIGSR